ncbi:hypothetical protein AKI40_2142 [Enterobacter sp. FY-07]|nr:hypothetical protein AKI40_2142 [Enterobacter sp. FY-07]
MQKTKKPAEASFFALCGWGTRIRTSEWWNQNPLPYRLAIPQKCVRKSKRLLRWLGYEDSNLGMVESESTALPLGDTPTTRFKI